METGLRANPALYPRGALAAAGRVGPADGRETALHSQLLDWFREAEDATIEARQRAERDRDYYDGDQLDETTRAELRRRGQPEVVINRIKRKIDYLLGHERATRTDPKAYPRTMQHEGAAEAATDALRYLCDAQRFDVARSAVWENMLVEGFGGVEIGARVNARGEIEPTITHVPWDRLFYDPHARRGDFADAKYVGIVLWMDRDEAEERWPEARGLFEQMFFGSGRTYEDKPGAMAWADGARKRIRVCQMYYKRRGVWHLCFFTGAGMLAEAQPVPYVDEDGEPECPLVLQSAYVDRDNRRYGVVREMVSPQDELNKRRSKALHLISVRQTIGEQGAVADVRAMKKELAKPDGHVEIAPGLRFEIAQTSDMAMAQFNLLQEAKQEIDLIGPNAAMTGKDDRAPSGRAILASQQGGTIELGPLSDALRQWQWRVYRQLWNRVRQYWREPKWIRVTDDEESLRWVGLNRPVTLGEKIQRDPEMAQRLEALRQQTVQTAGPAGLAALEQELAGRLGEPVEVENDTAEMDVDISLQDAPDTVALQGEQFEQLVQLAQALPGAIPPDALIEASALRTQTKKRLLDRLKESAAAPAPDPLQQAAAEATVRKTQSEAARNEAQAQKTALEAGLTAAAATAPPPVVTMPPAMAGA